MRGRRGADHHKADAKAGADGSAQAMQGMSGGMMQGGMMMHKRMQAMQKRMDMMQKMMEQIVAEQRMMMDMQSGKRRK